VPRRLEFGHSDRSDGDAPAGAAAVSVSGRERSRTEETPPSGGSGALKLLFTKLMDEIKDMRTDYAHGFKELSKEMKASSIIFTLIPLLCLSFH
jgi:hypothetical protein